MPSAGGVVRLIRDPLKEPLTGPVQPFLGQGRPQRIATHLRQPIASARADHQAGVQIEPAYVRVDMVPASPARRLQVGCRTGRARPLAARAPPALQLTPSPSAISPLCGSA
jgi:hypothetical protein